MDLLKEVNGDAFYVGELSPAVLLATKDRFVREFIRDGGETPVHVVHLCDSPIVGLDPDCDDVAEWGAGSTPEEALRFALGAFFGPIDSEYDEAALRDELERLSA